MYPNGFGNFGKYPISQSRNTYVTTDGLYKFDPYVKHWTPTELGISAAVQPISTLYDGRKPFGKDIVQVNSDKKK